jgi:hypothetical protein
VIPATGGIDNAERLVHSGGLVTLVSPGYEGELALRMRGQKTSEGRGAAKKKTNQ